MDAELERLQQALKILSDAEKQIRVSSERPTWFTAALLQLGCGHSSDMNQPKSSTRESSSSRTVSHSLPAFGISEKTLEHKPVSVHSSPQVLASHSSRSRLNDNLIYRECMSVDRVPFDSNQLNGNSSKHWAVVNENSDNLGQIWIRCIENCHSKTLQQLLLDHGKLVSIKQFEGKHILRILL